MIHLNKQPGAVFGAIIFLIPLFFFILWIYAFNHAQGYPDDVNLYQSYLPAFLKGRFTTTILSFVLCVIAAGLNLRNLKNSNRLLRGISWLVVIAAGLLGFLNLFSMM
ncbi:MAG: hypothetical protein ACJ75B_10730 [Flavisolibacter sp.]